MPVQTQNVPVSLYERDQKRIAALQDYYERVEGVRVSRSAVMQRAIAALFLSLCHSEETIDTHENELKAA